MGSNEMSEWQRFRQKVVAAQPEGEELGPRRFMVGVLLADRDPNGELTHLDFKWIKAHNVRTFLFSFVVRRWRSTHTEPFSHFPTPMNLLLMHHRKLR